MGLSGALMPGPLMTVTIDTAARRGFVAGMLPTAGHALAEATVVAALALGLSQLLASNQVTGAIALVGGLVLVWLGYGMGRGAWQGQVSLATAGAGPSSRLGPVPLGIVVSVGNPYWVLWWATVGATYVVAALQWGVTGVVIFFGGHITADLAWLALVAGVIARGRRLFGDRAYRAIILVCGLFLVGLGLFFAISGLGYLQARG